MTESLDQIFVTLKHWLLSGFENLLKWLEVAPPDWLMPLVSMVLSLAPILMVFPALFAITTVLERKGLGRIQNRYGPNRVGPFGFLQFAADVPRHERLAAPDGTATAISRRLPTPIR